MENKIDVQKITSILIIGVILIYTATAASSIILPFLFGILFALLLLPICQRIEQKLPSRILSIILAFFVVLVPLIGVILVFSFQFISIFENVSSLGESLEKGMEKGLQLLNSQLGFSTAVSPEWLKNNASKFLEGPANFIGKSISSSSLFLGNLLLSMLYCFFLLLYRQSIKNFILYQVGKTQRKENEQILLRIQQVVQEYLSGLGMVMLILGVINSIGLYFIGIPHALFWGFLAAFLAAVPYIGTFLGGFFPFLFSLTVADSYVQPLLVILLFGVVQTVEGNIITPKIIGSSVRINPLAAILSLVICGTMWGIGGLILAIPLVAIVRVIINQFDALKPFGFLLSDNIYGQEEIFSKKFNRERFRLRSIFSKDKTNVE